MPYPLVTLVYTLRISPETNRTNAIITTSDAVIALAGIGLVSTESAKK